MLTCGFHSNRNGMTWTYPHSRWLFCSCSKICRKASSWHMRWETSCQLDCSEPTDPVFDFQEIKEATSIDDSELRRHLQSLACAKFKILKKHPAGRDVNATDAFSFNDDFTSPLQKIKISTIASKVETNEERKETNDRIEEERRHQTDVCISLLVILSLFLSDFC